MFRLPTLINNWRDWWKWYSTHWFMVIGAVETNWAIYGDKLTKYIPAAWLHGAVAAAAVAGIATRILAQAGLIGSAPEAKK